jgi:hypothetical protein
LLLDDTKYDDGLSMSLMANFGADMPGSATAMGSLITAACQALIGWPIDLDVAEPATELLAALTKGSEKQQLALKCESMRGLADQFRLPDSSLAMLPVELQTQIALALCRAFSAATDADRAQYFQHVIQPMHEQFKATLGSVTAATAQGPAAKRVVLRYLYVLRGVAAALGPKTASLFWGVFAELIGPLPGVVKLYTTSTDVGAAVVWLVADVIKYGTPLLPGAQKGVLYQSAIASIQEYAKSCSGSETSADDIDVLLQVLSAIAETVLFGREDASSPVQVSAVLLNGVQTLPTIVTPALLQIPDLCLNVFEVLRRVTAENTNELYAAEALTVSILEMLATGAIGSDEVARRAADAIVSICQVHAARVQQGRGSVAVAAAIVPLLDVLARLVRWKIIL